MPAQARQQEEEPGLMDVQKQLTGSMVEPILTLGSAAVGEVAGGLAGLYELAATRDPDAAEALRQRVSGALAYEPKTAGGQIASQVLTAPSAAPAAAMEKATELSGEAGYRAGGPEVGAVASTFPTIASMVYGGVQGRAMRPRTDPGRQEVGGLPAIRDADAPIDATPTAQGVGVTPPARPSAADLSPQKQEIARNIEQGSTDASVAPYRLDRWQGVAGDPVAKKAINQGFDESVISAVKAATPEDRQKMMRMLAIRQRGHKNARYAMDNRASDVAGDSLMRRVRHVKRTNEGAGKRLDSVAKTLKGQQVNYNGPIGDFLSSLRDMGVTMDDRLRPAFKGSDIEGVEGAERVVKRIIARMRDTKTPDAYDLHRLKRYIDEQVTYGKSADGLGGKTERVLKKLRRDLDSTLDSQFEEYNRVNTQYSDTVNAIDALQDAAGTKVNLYGENADKAIGTVLRRLMSNTQSRVNLIDAIDELETVGRKYGGRFTDDLKAQMLFADELDKRFGPTARTSLAGEVEKGTKRAAELATGQRTVTGAAAEAAAEALAKARGVNDDAAFRSMRELLKQQL